MANGEHPPPGEGTDDRQQLLDRHRQRVAADSRGVLRGSSATSAHATDWARRHWTSRLLHRLGEGAAHSGAGVVAAVLVVVWGVIGLAFGYPTWWQITLYSVTASLTFVMVFVIHHAQERQTAGTQRKLDELIRSSVHADNSLIAVEEAPDEDLQALTHLNLADRRHAAGDGRG